MLKKRLAEVPLMSTHNMFLWINKKNILWIHLIWSYETSSPEGGIFMDTETKRMAQKYL